MKEDKKYKFKRFEDDLHQEIKKSGHFELLYKIESAKLKMAEKLAELREKMGLTQAQLAKRMRVSQQLISRIESGSDNITVETLVRFFDMLGYQLQIDVRRRKQHQEILKFV